MCAESDEVSIGSSFFERSPEQIYFQSLEALMIEQRGAPLQLSPDDWQIAKLWYADQIPLDVVREAVSSVIEKRRAKAKEIPRRLSFFRESVEEAWKRISGLAAPGKRREAPEFDLEGRLERLTAALLSVVGSVAWLGDLPDSVRSAAADRDGIEDVEETLAELDCRLLERAGAALDEEAAARLEAEVSGALVAYLDLSPEPPSPAVEERLRAEALRRTLSLPILSLFAPEASVEDREPSSAP